MNNTKRRAVTRAQLESCFINSITHIRQFDEVHSKYVLEGILVFPYDRIPSHVIVEYKGLEMVFRIESMSMAHERFVGAECDLKFIGFI